MRIAFLLILIAISGCLQTPRAETQKHVLDNGMVLITKENHANMIVATKLLVKTGSWAERREELGMRNFVQQMLLKGTTHRSAEEIAFETDSKGISLVTGVADDYLEVTMIATSEFFESGLEILADIVMNPGFPGEEIEAERGRILQSIKAQEDEQFNSARLLFLKELYGEHPYGYNPLGTTESVRAIGREALMRFHNTHYSPNNIVMAITGDIEAEKAKEMVEEKFRDFKPRELSEKPRFEIPKKAGNASLVKEREQSFVIIGFNAAPIASSDYSSLKVLSSILGGGASSRLYVNLREKLGLAYQIGSFYPTRVEDSYVAAYIGTAPENEDKVRELLLGEFEDLKNKPVSNEELAIAKKSMVGDFELDHESNERQAFYLAWYEAIGMGYEYDARYPSDVEKVTAQDVQHVAQKYLQRPVVARVGPS